MATSMNYYWEFAFPQDSSIVVTPDGEQFDLDTIHDIYFYVRLGRLDREKKVFHWGQAQPPSHVRNTCEKNLHRYVVREEDGRLFTGGEFLQLLKEHSTSDNTDLVGQCHVITEEPLLHTLPMAVDARVEFCTPEEPKREYVAPLSEQEAQAAYRAAWHAWVACSDNETRRGFEQTMDAMQPFIAIGPWDPRWQSFIDTLPGYREVWAKPSIILQRMGVENTQILNALDEMAAPPEES